jgi:small subunit ribosomal protein S16
LGYYNPRAKTDKGELPISLDVEATRAWLAKGAQPTDTVISLLKKAQVFDVQPVGS